MKRVVQVDLSELGRDTAGLADGVRRDRAAQPLVPAALQGGEPRELDLDSMAARRPDAGGQRFTLTPAHRLLGRQTGAERGDGSRAALGFTRRTDHACFDCPTGEFAARAAAGNLLVRANTGRSARLPVRSSVLLRIRLWWLIVASACAAIFTPVPVRAATVEGRVVLPKARATPVVNQRYEIVTKAGVLSTNPPVAIVYLEGTFSKPATPPVTRILQKDLTFLPSLLPVQTGTKVEFPNLDDTYHNIFSFSPPKRFDLGRYRADEKPVPAQVWDPLESTCRHASLSIL